MPLLFRNIIHYSLFLFFILTISSCATYYQKNIVLQNYITSGNFDEANKLLESDKKGNDGNNRVLSYMNKGYVNFMMGNHEQSNFFFNKADLYNEDYTIHFSNEVLSLISNPMIKPYKLEDFEVVMIHYYKSLNYLMLNSYEEALIECRRVNIQLKKLNDKYKKSKNKYANDAFAHNLMGMIYEASGDKNNAFIAYRNAYESYTNEYKDLFKIDSPKQLKKDLIRTAYQIGFMQEYEAYSNEFNLIYNPETEKDGSLIFLWMNGFGPFKSEWSINFINAGYNNGWITLINDDYNLNFLVYVGNRKSDEQNAFKNMSFLRVTFPKYVERKPRFQNASILCKDEIYPLELSENINAIAFQSLRDRMIRELSNGIARLATKKALETIANNENESLGTIVSIVNAVTEKADTRNWQSLPYAIHYSRIPLTKGENQINLNVEGIEQNKLFDFNISRNETIFFTYHQLESR